MLKPKYKIGDRVKYNCKYQNEIVEGEIINIRPSNLNWDYKLRYQISTNLDYIEWILEENILFKCK